MKSAYLAVLTFLLCVLFSCKKDSGNPAPPDNRPLQVVKKISRSEFNGQVTTDSIAYGYDDAGHLITITDLKTKQLGSKITYAGDTVTAVYTFGTNGYSDTVRRPIKYYDGGNTIVTDFTRPNTARTGMDTVLITYKWSGDQLLETWVYLHMFGSSNTIFQKMFVTYDKSGNEFENSTYTPIGGTFLQSRGLAYDQKKNLFNTMSRLNYIFMGWGFPSASRSVNNPIKGEDGSGNQVEYIWTYNKDDYPLTMQVKGKNYLAVEITYNK